MSLTIPWQRGTGTHRADDRIAELRDENVRLLDRQAAADDYFAVLLADRADMYAAWRDAVHRADLADDIATARLVAACEATARAQEAEQQAADMRAELLELRAYKAQNTAITVPSMVRDTSNGADQATAPIDVRPLWDALREHAA
ncbi:hypothetical protein OG875_05240 [Streptomyces sp. NBC_01498]|uniref:hypothetical protein n=1 Tax=Streptomyces sp. NBC_01498 TaxID=2975870 RepID=UPI002E7BCA54|nr:hypothetical protein [Streptomyces sp. NBC_01498]WTL24063.1 hypothetical protein OG875_05240 [Streptomyces sp. NBC_01498]